MGIIIFICLFIIFIAVLKLIAQYNNAKSSNDVITISRSGEWTCPECDYKNTSGRICKSCGYEITESKKEPLKSPALYSAAEQGVLSKTQSVPAQITARKQTTALATYNSDWEITVSFSKSSSKSFTTALFLAKQSPKFLESDYEDKHIYQATFSSEPTSYLNFIRLYELVSNWKSTAVMINGKLIDRKIIGGLNFCYGDKCRNGRKDFCYGASDATNNPFGCHRLQMSASNHPWYSFSNFDGRNYVIDKPAIINRAREYATAYRVCPDFNWDNIERVIYELPDKLSKKEYIKLAGELAESIKSETATMPYTAKNSSPVSNSSKSLPGGTPNFDYQTEKEALQELSYYKNDIEMLHSTYMKLQDLYYKYRKSDSKYMNLCKEYCARDIAILHFKKIFIC